MNWPALAIGFAFLAIGVAFRKPAPGQDEKAIKNKKFASNFFLFASVAFFFAAAVSAYSEYGGAA